jgi:hypothetical protein
MHMTILVCRIALGQEDAFHLISVEGLGVSTDANYDLHTSNRN